MKFKALVSLLLSTMLWANTGMAAGLLTPVGSASALEIKSHLVNVTVEDSFAITEVEQVFSNKSNQDSEAIYSFPVPKDASVGEFTYWIDGQPVHGEVLERKQAKEIYQQEKHAGREAALVEKNSFKTFEIMVTPVRANDDVRIRLVYLQPVPVDMGIGRYVYPLQDGGVDIQQQAFWSQNSEVEAEFKFNINVRSSYPVEGVRFASHQSAQVKQLGEGEWLGEISSSNTRVNNIEKEIKEIESSNGKSEAHYADDMPAQDIHNAVKAAKLDQDIVVYWRHAEGLPGSVDIKTYKLKDKRQGTFSVVVTPGEELKQITEGSDWIFVLDISGSMQGKLAALLDGMSQAIDKFSIRDRFRVIVFNNRAREITQGYMPATPENKQWLQQEVSKLNASSGTNLYAGLKQALWQTDADRSSAILLVTDGVANVGKTEKEDFFDLIKDKDIRLFTFVMGNSANQPLLENLSKFSNGFSQSISTGDDIIGQVMWATEKMRHEALHDVRISIDGVKVADLSPEDIGSIYRGQQISVFGHYFGSGPAELTIRGKISGEDKQWRTQINLPEHNESYPELERLWAYGKIKDLELSMDKLGPDSDSKSAIRDLALEYGLVTNHTSMLVVREEVFAQHGIERKNKKRIEKEHSARKQRLNAPINKQSMEKIQGQQKVYANSRPAFSSGSGGSTDIFLIGLLFVISMVFVRKGSR